MQKVSHPEGQTYRGLLKMLRQKLAAAGLDNARQEAEWILREVLECSRAALYGYPERKVTAQQQRQAAQMAQRRVEGEPLQYIVGHTDFYGLRLEVTPKVLIPRPETERVVEEALQRIRALEQPRVLDVGTGSGCIAVAIAHERADADVHACDLSAAALEVARRNAAVHGVSVAFHELDVTAESIRAIGVGPFDLIISNPPYIPAAEFDELPAEVRAYEPEEALLCGDDPLYFYRRITAQAAEEPARGGWLVFEVHAPYADEVADLLRDAGFQQVRTETDLVGRPRIVFGSHEGRSSD